MTRHLPAAAVIAATAMLTACTATTTPAPASTNPRVGITTHATITADTTVTQVTNWWTGGGKTHLNQIATDFGKLGTDGTDPTTIHTDCQTISNDVSTAQTYGPVPDTQAQTHWNAALLDYQQGAAYCLAGTSAMDTATINAASAKFQAGTRELNAVTARITVLATSG